MFKPDRTSAYDRLGVPPHTDPEEIHRVYLRLSEEGDGDDLSLLTAAWESLSSPKNRVHVDAMLLQTEAEPSVDEIMAQVPPTVEETDWKDFVDRDALLQRETAAVTSLILERTWLGHAYNTLFPRTFPQVPPGFLPPVTLTPLTQAPRMGAVTQEPSETSVSISRFGRFAVLIIFSALVLMLAISQRDFLLASLPSLATLRAEITAAFEPEPGATPVTQTTPSQRSPGLVEIVPTPALENPSEQPTQTATATVIASATAVATVEPAATPPAEPQPSAQASPVPSSNPIDQLRRQLEGSTEGDAAIQQPELPILPTEPAAIDSPPLNPTPSPEPSPVPVPVTVQARFLTNIRSGPGTEFDILELLQPDERRPVIERTGTGDWLRISTTSGQDGWVVASVVVVNGDLTTVPQR